MPPTRLDYKGYILRLIGQAITVKSGNSEDRERGPDLGLPKKRKYKSEEYRDPVK